MANGLRSGYLCGEMMPAFFREVVLSDLNDWQRIPPKGKGRAGSMNDYVQGARDRQTDPLHRPAAQQARLKPRIDAAIQRVLAHGQFIMGPEVRQFEARASAVFGAPPCNRQLRQRHRRSGPAADGLGDRRGRCGVLPGFTFAATPRCSPGRGDAGLRATCWRTPTTSIRPSVEAAIRR